MLLYLLCDSGDGQVLGLLRGEGYRAYAVFLL